MTIIDDIVSSLDEDAAVKNLQVGLRATLVWSRYFGMASTIAPESNMSKAGGCKRPLRLSDMSAKELAQLASSKKNSLHASVGMAAINSLLLPAPQGVTEGNAFDLILEKSRGKRITVVGHFPFVDKLRKTASHVSVLELNPREGDLPASEAPNVIPKSDIVALTGTTLINHTIDDLLRLAKDAYVVMLGPSTPLSPVLFDYGVDVLGGISVEDPEETRRCISEGYSFRHTEGVKYLLWTGR